MANEPPTPHDKGVVINMQKRKLIVLLPQNHKGSVQQLNVLVIVMDPDQEGHLVGRSFGSVPPDTQSVVVDLHDERVDAPKVQKGLVEVVCEHVTLQGKWLSVLHELDAQVNRGQIDDATENRYQN